MRRSSIFLAAIAGAVLLADQITKALVRGNIAYGESLPLIDGFVYLTHVRNTGAAFSLLEGNRWFFAVVASAVVVATLVWWYRERPASRFLALGVGLLVGGAVGNLIDRVASGFVTDFLDVRIWPVFNVADSAVVIGVALVAWYILSLPEPQAESDRPPADDAHRQAGA